VHAEEVTASGLGFCFWFAEVGDIVVSLVDHVAGVEADSSIGVSGCIVEEAPTGFESCLHFFGLG
jgi:hypothetical protein